MPSPIRSRQASLRRAAPAAVCAALCCGVLAPAAAGAALADHPVLSEVVVQVRTTPLTGSKYVELVNPTAVDLDLSDVHLTDATFNSPPTYYYDIVKLGGAGGGGSSGDFHARFPAGATLAAGDTIAVAITGSAEYQAAYGRLPDYELYEDGIAPDAVPELAAVFPGSIGRGLGTANTNTPDLTSGGETVVLYRWDGQSDLVQDLDYVIWGTVVSVRVDKTLVSVDGPDPDTTPSDYLPDTSVAIQQVVASAAHNYGNSFQRRSLDEGTETAAGGNGLTGHDETSEPLGATWRIDLPNSPPLAPIAFTPPAPIVTRAEVDPAQPWAAQPIAVVATVLAFDTVEEVSLYWSADGGAFTEVACAPGEGNDWTGQIPAQEVGVDVRWYLRATGSGGGVGVLPAAAPLYFNTFTVQDAPNWPPLLLISEVCVLGSSNEFVEIVNPGTAAVDLGNYYLTDAIYAPQYYWRIVLPNPTQATVGGGDYTDFHARFPDGATVAAGDTITVAVAGSAAFEGVYGYLPDYELFEDGGEPDEIPDMREVFPGSIVGSTSPSLSNAGEIVVLYHWDGASDLVTDIDVFLWGTATSYRFDKTGVSIDGPDADTTPSAYLPDTAVGAQQPFTTEHAFGDSYTRVDGDEGAEVGSGGNGTFGHNETSEDLPNTFAIQAASPAYPGTGGLEGGGGVTLVVPARTFLPRFGEVFPVKFRSLLGCQTEVRIYDLTGRHVVTLFDSRFDGIAATAPDRFTERRWDGRDDEFEFVPAGVYVVHLAVTNARSGDRETKTAPVVVATRLSD